MLKKNLVYKKTKDVGDRIDSTKAIVNGLYKKSSIERSDSIIKSSSVNLDFRHDINFQMQTLQQINHELESSYDLFNRMPQYKNSTTNTVKKIYEIVPENMELYSDERLQGYLPEFFDSQYYHMNHLVNMFVKRKFMNNQILTKNIMENFKVKIEEIFRISNIDDCFFINKQITSLTYKLIQNINNRSILNKRSNIFVCRNSALSHSIEITSINKSEGVFQESNDSTRLFHIENNYSKLKFISSFEDTLKFYPGEQKTNFTILSPSYKIYNFSERTICYFNLTEIPLASIMPVFRKQNVENINKIKRLKDKIQKNICRYSGKRIHFEEKYSQDKPISKALIPNRISVQRIIRFFEKKINIQNIDIITKNVLKQ